MQGLNVGQDEDKKYNHFLISSSIKKGNLTILELYENHDHHIWSTVGIEASVALNDDLTPANFKVESVLLAYAELVACNNIQKGDEVELAHRVNATADRLEPIGFVI